MTVQELIDYYSNLLIIQYKTLPNASSTIALLTSQVIADMIYQQVLNGFDLSSAIGNQLDILADYVGLQRAIPGFAPSFSSFQFPSYSDGPTGFGGFGDYSDTSAPPDFWRSYSTATGAYVLSDGQLRSLITYLVTLRNSDYSNSSIDNLFSTFFGQYATVTDGEDMTVTYTHDATNDPNQLFAIVNYLGLLPRPAGVTVTVVEV